MYVDDSSMCIIYKLTSSQSVLAVYLTPVSLAAVMASQSVRRPVAILAQEICPELPFDPALAQPWLRSMAANSNLRFLNMAPTQERKRRNRVSQRKRRLRLRKQKTTQARKGNATKQPTPKKKKRNATEHPVKKKRKGNATEHSVERIRNHRPCCGLRGDKCACRAPPGMRGAALTALAKRFVRTPLSTWQDTTDVSGFHNVLRDRCRNMPTSAVLCYCFVHVVFNQQYLLEAMVKEKAFLFRQPWVDWERLHEIVARAKARNMVVRSSNYYSATLRSVSLYSSVRGNLLQSNFQVPKNGVARDVLACRLVGVTAMPTAVCDLYDAAPSRDLWKAMLLQWLSQVHRTCAGAFDHYYMKCCLDRLFVVKTVDPAFISWWPTECPSYQVWYKDLCATKKTLTEEERFQILCSIFRKLNSSRNCTFPEALAQTCWSIREKAGTLDLK